MSVQDLSLLNGCVVLLRLDDVRAVVKIETLLQLLQSYADQLPGQFVVVTETRVRFARK